MSLLLAPGDNGERSRHESNASAFEALQRRRHLGRAASGTGDDRESGARGYYPPSSAWVHAVIEQNRDVLASTRVVFNGAMQMGLAMLVLFFTFAAGFQALSIFQEEKNW